MARQQKQQAAVSQHAQWLLDHAPGSAYEQSALVIRALELDQQIAAASAPGQGVLKEAFDVYRRLLSHLGEDAQTVQQNKNAKVACARLATYAQQLGRTEESAAYLRILVEAFPSDQDYLQQLGRREFELGNYEAALPHWRTLLVGLDKTSEPWFEAKYHQLACLYQTDPEQAQTVLEQFRLLHPDWGLSPWRDKIKALAQ